MTGYVSIGDEKADVEEISIMELDDNYAQYRLEFEMQNVLNKGKKAVEMKHLSLLDRSETERRQIISNIVSGCKGTKVTEKLNENNNNPDTVEIPWWKNKNFKMESAINISSDGGVKKILIESGHGRNPFYGCTVIVKYAFYVPKAADYSDFRHIQTHIAGFYLGQGYIVPALDMGIAAMKEGETSIFVAQPDFAFGDTNKLPSDVPQDSVIFFEVKLLECSLEDLSPQKDRTILRDRLKKGHVTCGPTEGCTIRINMCGSYNDKCFENRTVTFELGEGSTCRIPEAVEIALTKIDVKEKSLLFLKGKYAMDLQDRIDEPLNSDSIVKYEVTLESLERVSEVWQMNSDQKYVAAIRAREKGLLYFEDGNYKLASKQFKRIIECLENEPGISPAKAKPRKVLVLKAYLNDALCLMKLNNFRDAIRACTKALELDLTNEKALYRRAQCYLETHDWNEALEGFQAVLRTNPNNTASQKMIPVCLNKIREQKAKDKSTYNNMFQKFVYEEEVSVKAKEEEIIQMLN